MARVLAIANPSSRSGKTSAALGMATMLVDLGQQVLAVDLDAQAGLTRALGVDAETLESSLFDVLVHGAGALDAMVDTDAGVDLLPAALELSGADAILVTRAGREQLLHHALAPVIDDYDWVIIDCAPSMGLLTQNALGMAQHLMIPVREYSARAMAQLLDAAREIRSYVNPRLGSAALLPVGTQITHVPDGATALPAVPAPPLDLNAYRELAKALLRG